MCWLSCSPRILHSSVLHSLSITRSLDFDVKGRGPVFELRVLGRFGPCHLQRVQAGLSPGQENGISVGPR